MNRTCITFLTTWLASNTRKPLVIRGARQVGKTWLVRHLAQTTQRQLVEINFEKRPQFASLFASNDPSQILLQLSAVVDQTIDPSTSLLFLDEIQAVPELLAKLRWFAEDLPELPVICAGSLLEFTLESHHFSMPVGRIQYMHLEPLSFEEFLDASGKETLLAYVRNYVWESEIPLAIHQQFLQLIKEYLLVGGMPAAVSAWVQRKSLSELDQLHHDLMATYRDDLAKYRGRIAIDRFEEVLAAIPRQLGRKFMYTKVNPAVQIASIKQSMELLCKAKVCHRIQGCAANGVPLAAELQEKYFKLIFLDVGLCSAAWGLSFAQVSLAEEITFIHSGALAEQVAGQLLRTVTPHYAEPALYCWHREQKGSSAEIDYILQHGNKVVPVEVKAGSTGSLKSLHLFMGLKGFSLAVRINSDLPSHVSIEMKNHQGNVVKYQLLSLPFYLIGQIHRLISSAN